ncbi:hypothetical protein Q9966_002283 [Columba livia]|nr:hypothetical protein Q9966_002283 [Columba livia]
MALLRRVRERPPSDGASAPGTAGASELREKRRGGLHGAAARGDLAWLQQRWWRKRFSINSRDANKQTPLHLACANGHADVVRFLAGKRCQLNPHGMFEKTPLMLAVEHEHKDCVTALLEHGADPDHRGAGGNTALHMAAIMPSKAMVELLLKHNAQIEAKNVLGYTPLAIAILQRHEEMVEFLIQKGADVHTRDLHDRTTLVIAAYAGNVNVLRLLLQHGVDLFHRNKYGSDVFACHRQFKPEVIKTLEEYENCKRTGERSVGGTGGPAVPEISCSGTTAAPPMGAPVQTGAGVLPAAGAAQEEEDFDLSSLDEGFIRWLWQELVSALRNCSRAEVSLEVEKRCSRDLQQQKLQLQKELNHSKAQLQELQERLIRSECYAEALESAIKNKERELTAARNLQSLLVTSSGTAAIPELEERMQQLQVGMAKLEATGRQQANTMEALLKELRASASRGSESKELKKPAEKKHQLEAILEETQTSNGTLEEEPSGLETLLEASQAKLMEYTVRKRESQPSFQRGLKNSCSEVAKQVGKQRRKQWMVMTLRNTDVVTQMAKNHEPGVPAGLRSSMASPSRTQSRGPK